jgi:hypothetical protein
MKIIIRNFQKTSLDIVVDYLEQDNTLVFMSGLAPLQDIKSGMDKLWKLATIKNNNWNQVYIVFGPNELQYLYEDEYQNKTFITKFRTPISDIFCNFSVVASTHLSLGGNLFSYYGIPESLSHQKDLAEEPLSEVVREVKDYYAIRENRNVGFFSPCETDAELNQIVCYGEGSPRVKVLKENQILILE